MLKIGLIDDEMTNFSDYAIRLKRHEIELLFYEGNSDLDSILNWIIANEVLCVFVDYDLQKKFSHNGTDLVFGLNQLLPDFPCIMLTNYPERSRSEKLVAKRLIWDREKLNAPDLSEVVDIIRNEVEVFIKRKTSLAEQYSALAKKEIAINLQQSMKSGLCNCTLCLVNMAKLMIFQHNCCRQKQMKN